MPSAPFGLVGLEFQERLPHDPTIPTVYVWARWKRAYVLDRGNTGRIVVEFPAGDTCVELSDKLDEIQERIATHGKAFIRKQFNNRADRVVQLSRRKRVFQ